MTGEELLNLYNKGIHPIVKFKEPILDLELQFEPEMLAKIVSIDKDNSSSGLYRISLDESEFKSFNKKLEKPICYNKETNEYDLKWSEVQKRKDIEIIYLDEDEKTFELENFEIIPDAYSELVSEYLDCNSELSYIEWLQEKLLEMRALYK